MPDYATLNHSNITFPLAAGTKILTDDETAEPDFDKVVEILAENEITGVELIDDRTVSLERAISTGEKVSQRSFEALFNDLAPIIPNGCYAQFEASYVADGYHEYRLVISDDKAIIDCPNVFWDNPIAIASNRYIGSVEQELTGEGVLDYIGEHGRVPVPVATANNQIGLAFESEDGDLVVQFINNEDGTPHQQIIDADTTLLVWTPTTLLGPTKN